MRCLTCDHEIDVQEIVHAPTRDPLGMAIPLSPYHTRCECGWPMSTEEFFERGRCQTCRNTAQRREHAAV